MKLEESKFFAYFNIVMGAELLNYMATIILLKIAQNLNKTEDANNFSDRVKLSSWNYYLSKFNEVKHDVLTYLEYQAESSFLMKVKLMSSKMNTKPSFNRQKN